MFLDRVWIEFSWSGGHSPILIRMFWGSKLRTHSTVGWERIWPSKFLTQIRYRFLIPPRYKNSCLISSFVQSRSYLAWFFQKTQNYYWNRSNQGKTKDTVKSHFGSYGFGKNCIYHAIPHAIRVPKTYILSMLEIPRVITTPIPLCFVMMTFLNLNFVNEIFLQHFFMLHLSKSLFRQARLL